MNKTFSRKIAFSFALLCLLTVATVVTGLFAVSRVVEAKERIQTVNDYALSLAGRLQTATYRKSAAIRGFILAPSQGFYDSLRRATDDTLQLQNDLAAVVDDAEGKGRIADIAAANTSFDERLRTILAMQARGESMAAQTHYMVTSAMPQRLALEKEVDDFNLYETRRLEQARRSADKLIGRYRLLLLVWSGSVLLAALLLSWLLSRDLSGKISGAVQEIQTSAAELQSTATQQAAGAREQATAMSEITTTMTELLTTSRQIADSSQRVAEFSRQTAEAARSSDLIVDRSQDSLNAIRSRVDEIVNYMLDLGRKSQQIGGLVEVISELAEQTNILAINANIEAAGAGDSGRRFAVVADEIRKLADRVAASARQTRGMVDDVRAAINTTVMATETGSKAVDAGSRDFAEVTRSLDQIQALVATATEAAREIELSTKQQSTAVEQVNLAVGNVAQVSRDMELSTTQASATANQLARLSASMTELIRPTHDLPGV